MDLYVLWYLPIVVGFVGLPVLAGLGLHRVGLLGPVAKLVYWLALGLLSWRLTMWAIVQITQELQSYGL